MDIKTVDIPNPIQINRALKQGIALHVMHVIFLQGLAGVINVIGPRCKFMVSHSVALSALKASVCIVMVLLVARFVRKWEKLSVVLFGGR